MCHNSSGLFFIKRQKWLCIVQDDEEEWQREAADMSTIYEGSQLTISAVQSMNSSQGCILWLASLLDHLRWHDLCGCVLMC